MSAQGAPVRSRQKIPFKTRRSSARGTPLGLFGSSGWITVQGKGRMGKLNLQTPAMIRFGEETEDEVYISAEAAARGVEIENTGSEPLVGLRYFGPNVHKSLPKIGDYKKAQ